MNSKVSVIIPVYNSEKFISETINSVLSQTFTDYEIVVIDDGSIDKTREIIDEFIQKYLGKIRYIYQENQGVSVARNNGILNSSGEYIAFLDHDDLWLPAKLLCQVEYMDNHSEIAFSFTETKVINEAGEEYAQWRHENTRNTFFELCQGDYIHALTVMVRREALAKVGLFDPDLLVAQDYDLWLRLARNFSSGIIKTPLAKYRIHQSNLSRNLDGSLQNHLAIFNKREIVSGLSYKQKCFAVSKQYIYFAKKYEQRKLFFKTSRCYLLACIYFPLIGAYYWKRRSEGSFLFLSYRVFRFYAYIIYFFFLGIKKALLKNE